MFTFRIPHLGHLHLLRVSHEHPPEKILFKTASIMQIASILLICKLPNTTCKYLVCSLGTANLEFPPQEQFIVVACYQTPKLFWVNRKHSPNKLNHSLVSFVFHISVTWISISQLAILSFKG